VLHLAVAPGAKVITEPGLMMYFEPGITAGTNCSNCCAKYIAGNPIIMNSYTNSGEALVHLGLTPDIPAKVIPLDLDGGKKYNCKSGTFMASTGDAKVGFSIDCNPCTAIFAGQGCCRQTVGGGDTGGVAYLAAMGTISKKTLAAGETLVMDTNSLVAWDQSTKLGVRGTGGGLMAPCVAECGGEGCCNTTVSGPGEIYIQSMNFENFKANMGLRVQKNGQPADGGGDGGAPPEGAEMER